MHQLFFAIITACHFSYGGATQGCATYNDTRPQRSLSECLIRVEDVNRELSRASYLRNAVRLTEGTCTTKEPA